MAALLGLLVFAGPSAANALFGVSPSFLDILNVKLI